MCRVEVPMESRGKLLEIAGHYRRLAESIEAMCRIDEPKEPEAKPTEEVAAAPKKEEKKPEVKLEQVRGFLAGKSRDGFTAEVRALISKYGASRLSEIDPKDYASVLKDAEGIGHA